MSQRAELVGCRIRLRDWTLEDLPAYKHWWQPDGFAADALGLYEVNEAVTRARQLGTLPKLDLPM